MDQQTEQLMSDNLDQVWNERDADKRLIAIERIYAADAVLYHTGDKASGKDAINDSVTAVQQQLPPNFRFSLLKPVAVNHYIGRALWGAGPEGQQPQATGMDIAHIENGKIRSLFVFLES